MEMSCKNHEDIIQVLNTYAIFIVQMRICDVVGWQPSKIKAHIGSIMYVRLIECFKKKWKKDADFWLNILWSIIIMWLNNLRISIFYLDHQKFAHFSAFDNSCTLVFFQSLQLKTKRMCKFKKCVNSALFIDSFIHS